MRSEHTPVVSIAIPTRNRAHLLTQAIDSVLAQTFTDIELIICDNASSDSTEGVVREYMVRDARIRYCPSEQPLTACENWNRCIQQARGTITGILCDDDMYEPDFLASLVPKFQRHPEVGFAYAACYHVDESNAVTFSHVPFEVDHLWSGTEEFLHHAVVDYTLTPTVLVRTAAYQGVGAFNPEFPVVMDWDMWLRIELAGWSTAYTAKPLARYREHSGSDTSQKNKTGQMGDETHRFGRHILRHCVQNGIALPDGVRREILARGAVYFGAQALYALRQRPPDFGRAIRFARIATHHLHSLDAARGMLPAIRRALWRRTVRSRAANVG